MSGFIRWLKGGTRSSAGEPEPVVEAAAAPALDASVDRRLILSLGPVQGFIKEARRTRDVWAGSFLLSWLSAVAMRTIVEAVGGEKHFRFPRLEKDPLYKAFVAETEAPYQASLPNHCEVTIPAGVAFAPDTCAAAVHAKWRELADAVWAEFIEDALDVAARDSAREIWERQIGKNNARPFWELNWVMVPAHNKAEDLLERRKLWRTWPAADPEPPDLCTMMGDWQELSSHTRTTKSGKEAQKAFWNWIQKRLKDRLGRQATLIELRPDERLCAIACVKRLFALLPPETLGEIIRWPARHQLPHRIDDSYRPSTAYLAAGHWLPRAWRHAQPQCTAFTRSVWRARNAQPLAVAERISRLGLIAGHPRFARLDGKLLFEGSYEAETELKRVDDDAKKRLRATLKTIAQAKIPAVAAAEPEETVGRPSPYYAVLRMDGDEVGKLLRDYPDILPNALAEFADEVRTIIPGAPPGHHGELVFAGGDDLLALLPLESGLDAALTVRDAWRRTVDEKIAESATISAGLVFVHYEVALRWALEEARRQLEDAAKDANGRDSIAISVLGRRGPAVAWASTWGSAAGGDDIARALQALIGERHGKAAALLSSNRFAYGARERMSAFFEGPLAVRSNVITAPDDDWPTLDDDVARALLRAVGGEDATTVSEADLDNLCLLLRPHYRGDGVYQKRQAPLQLDALLLLRFLVTEWRKLPP